MYVKYHGFYLPIFALIRWRSRQIFEWIKYDVLKCKRYIPVVWTGRIICSNKNITGYLK